MSEYALAADRAGLQRYLLAGQRAHDAERDLWALAGTTNGATVADVGCGPGAVAVPLGRLSSHGFKPPVRSTGEAMVAAGYITPREFERWREAFRRIDADDAPVTYFLPIFCAIGRRLTGPTTSR